MADLLKFELVSPERLLSSGEVRRSSCRGPKASSRCWPTTRPVLATMKPGVVTVTDADGSEERIFVRGGFAEINPAGLTVLAEEAIAVKDLSAADLDEKISNAQEEEAQGARDA
jgi:F-type H+-transporting ATPase subunit epsilon